MIEDYLREFESALVGSPARKAELVAELRAHLVEAAEAGDLAGALDRLGTPAAAAAAFAPETTVVPATPNRRFAADLIDHIPLMLVIVALFIDGFSQGGNFWVTTPPAAVFSDAFSLFRNVVTALGLLWSFVGLSLIEARNGRTPGKALLRLRTITTDGSRVTRTLAFQRRGSILLGPLMWIDYLAIRFTKRRQRLLDLLTSTVVINEVGRPADAAAVRVAG